MTARACTALAALALDLTLGEPPTPLHPVVGMGRYLRWARARWRGTTPGAQLLEGGAAWVLGAAGSALVGALAARAPWWGQALALKPLLSARALFAAVRAVEAPLLRGDLPEARRLLAWHLVSRPTHDLSAPEVAAAAIESLFENLSDSVVAPLLAHQLGGLPLAALYRFANTADATWGYRTPELEWRGKVAARADDLLNLLPARLTALLVVAAAHAGFDGRGAWRTLRRDARRTASPNAGWPMAAAAGALGVRLTKRGHYTLGAGREARAQDLARARRLAGAALALGAAALLLGGGRA